MTTPRPSLSRHRVAEPVAALAALLLTAGPALAQHAGHAPPPPTTRSSAGAQAGHEEHGGHAGEAAAAPRDTAAPLRRVVQSGMAIDFSIRPATPAGTPGPIVADQDALLSLRFSDAATGAPMRGLELAGWIDRRRDTIATAAPACREKVDGYMQSRVYSMEGSFRTNATLDLNSYFVLSLNGTPEIAVIDPFLGFGRTKLYKTVPLQSPGEDWVLSPDGRRLFVTMPQVGGVAVVATDDWKIVSTVVAGAAPTGAMLAPGGKRLWVTNEPAPGAAGAEGGITVIDVATFAVAGRIPTAPGAHAVAFSADGRLAFVTNRASGTLSVIDVERLTKVKDVAIGGQPVDVAYSAASDAAYVTSQPDGALVVVSAQTLDVVARVPLAAGARQVRFAPENLSAHGHGAHGGHGAQASHATTKGRWAFVTNPAAKAVHVVDAVTNTVLRTMTFEHTPDEVGFTSAFAYVRFSDNPTVSLVSLDDPSTGGFGSLDKFEAGQAAPGALTMPGVSEAIAQAPDMPDALYVLNAKERMIYYYHYMEGMPIPSGGLTTYGYTPKSIMLAGKALRETEPGTYAATVKVAPDGEYDLVLLVPEPRVVECFSLSVRPDSTRPAPRPLVALVPDSSAGALHVGRSTVRFRVLDRRSGETHAALPGVQVHATSTDGWQQRASARPVDGDLYEVSLDVPAAGVYYLSLALPSLGVGVRENQPAMLRATAAPAATSPSH